VVSHEIILRRPAKVGPREGVAEVCRAVDRREVDLRVVCKLIPVNKPVTAGKEMFQAGLALKDLVAPGAHTRLQSSVVVVPNRLLTSREEAAVLCAEVHVARGRLPLIRASIKEADAASRDHNVELVVGHVVPGDGMGWDAMR
jgi:hypothetical protein